MNWFETLTFATTIATQHGVVLDHRALPVAGTPQWCGLPDDDARKLLSLILGGVREAISNDCYQTATAEARHEIAGATDWSAVAERARNGRGAAYIARRKDVA